MDLLLPAVYQRSQYAVSVDQVRPARVSIGVGLPGLGGRQGGGGSVCFGCSGKVRSVNTAKVRASTLYQLCMTNTGLSSGCREREAKHNPLTLASSQLA